MHKCLRLIVQSDNKAAKEETAAEEESGVYQDAQEVSSLKGSKLKFLKVKEMKGKQDCQELKVKEVKMGTNTKESILIKLCLLRLETIVKILSKGNKNNCIR
jgi:hypothetical protein